MVSIALAAGVPIERALLLGFAIAAAFALLWCALRLLRRLLWRVGRRLAFTYFLIGVLPIPMAAFLLAVAAYLLGGFLLGHLFRDALAVVEQEVVAAAETRLEDPASFAGAPARVGDVAFSYYVDGQRIAGDERGPAQWPSWLEAAPGWPRPAAGAARRGPLAPKRSAASARRHWWRCPTARSRSRWRAAADPPAWSPSTTDRSTRGCARSRASGSS